ncbi:MAG: universal stress protein [Desulfobacterales bacterium]|jgi:nucleotide-binding universal stress UspA family protein
MDPGIPRILYATDLSAKSIYGLHYAVNYAIKNEAKLIVFHSITKRSITVGKMMAYFFNEAQEDRILQEKANSAMRRMKNQLETICKKERKDHPEYDNNVEHLVVHYGRIAEEIVEKADMWECVSIVLGPHKNGFLKQLSPVSTLRKVLRLAHKPVHIIPLPKRR